MSLEVESIRRGLMAGLNQDSHPTDTTSQELYQDETLIAISIKEAKAVPYELK